MPSEEIQIIMHEAVNKIHEILKPIKDARTRMSIANAIFQIEILNTYDGMPSEKDWHRITSYLHNTLTTISELA